MHLLNSHPKNFPEQIALGIRHIIMENISTIKRNDEQAMKIFERKNFKTPKVFLE